MIQVKISWIYYALIANAIIVLPSFVYSYGDPNFHWLCHIMSMAISRISFIIFLIFILMKNVNMEEHYGLWWTLFFYFIFIPVYLADLTYIDKYDFLTRPARLWFWTISTGIIIHKLVTDKNIN